MKAAQNQKKIRRVRGPLMPREHNPRERQENRPAVSTIITRSSDMGSFINPDKKRENNPPAIFASGVISKGSMANEYSFFPKRRNTKDMAAIIRAIAQQEKSMLPEFEALSA